MSAPVPNSRSTTRVRDHRHVPLDERDPHAAPDEVAVALIVGMHRDRGVAEDRLGPRRGDRDPRVRVRLPGRLVDQVVADEPQRPRLRGRDDLEVADAGPTPRAPVDERLGAVRQAVAVQPLEGDPDGLRRALVHRVAEAAPVGRSPDAPLLPEHDRLRRVRELAHPLEVALAAERRAAFALPGEDPVEHELRRDRRVVEAGQEQRRMPAHPRVPDHQVLDGRSLGVAEVERPGHVRRRLDDRERRQVRIGGRAGAVRREHVRGEPALVDPALDLARDVRLGQGRPGRRRRRGRFGHSIVLRLLETTSPARPADERGRGTTSWFDVRCRLPGPWRPSWRAIGRLPHGSRATFTSGGPARLAPSRARFVAVRRYSSRSSP